MSKILVDKDDLIMIYSDLFTGYEEVGVYNYSLVKAHNLLQHYLMNGEELDDDLGD